MPATYQGNPTNFSSATAWAGGQVRALGALCTPSTPNGLVFICTTSGTTAAAEPAWNTPPYPTLGSVFTDGGGVGWTCYNSQPGNFSPILQLPVDTDPPLSFNEVVPLESVADQLAWLRANCGLLDQNNIWSGTNTFAFDVTFNNRATVTVNGQAQLLFTDYPVSTGRYNAALYGTSDPTTNEYIPFAQWNLGDGNTSQVFARLYLSNGGRFGVNSGTGITLTINAYWTPGSGHFNWTYDDSTSSAYRITLNFDQFAYGYYPSGQTSPFTDAAWTGEFVSYPGSTTFADAISMLSTLAVTGGFTSNTLGVGSNQFAVNASGQVTAVGGVATVSLGTTGTLQKFYLPGITTQQTLINNFPLPGTLAYVLEITGYSNTDQAPNIQLTYTDGDSSESVHNSSSINLIQSLPGTGGTNFYWCTVVYFYGKTGTNLLVKVQQGGSETIDSCRATLKVA